MTDALAIYEKPVDPNSPARFEKEQRNKAVLNYVKKNKIPRDQIGFIIWNTSDKENPIRVIFKKELDSKGNIKDKKTQKVIRDNKALHDKEVDAMRRDHDKEVEAMREEMNMDQSAEDAYKELESGMNVGGRVKKKKKKKVVNKYATGGKVYSNQGPRKVRT